MDEAREAEIRALAARFMAGTKHRRIGLVLVDLLAEIDLLRSYDESPHLSFDEAMTIVAKYATEHPARAARGASEWLEEVRRKAHLYA